MCQLENEVISRESRRKWVWEASTGSAHWNSPWRRRDHGPRWSHKTNLIRIGHEAVLVVVWVAGLASHHRLAPAPCSPNKQQLRCGSHRALPKGLDSYLWCEFSTPHLFDNCPDGINYLVFGLYNSLLRTWLMWLCNWKTKSFSVRK